MIVGFIFASLFSISYGRVYNIIVDVESGGGSDDGVFFGRLENSAGTRSVIFPLDDTYCIDNNCLTTGGLTGQTYTYNIDLLDIGTIKYLYIMTHLDREPLWVDGVTVDGYTSDVDIPLFTAINYGDADIHPNGCEIGVFDVLSNTESDRNEDQCVTFSTNAPTANPIPTAIPSDIPSILPSKSPSNLPTKLPTTIPSNIPSIIPTKVPSKEPTTIPTSVPTAFPTDIPTTAKPTRAPLDINETAVPTTSIPTNNPTTLPSVIPSIYPTKTPSVATVTNATELQNVNTTDLVTTIDNTDDTQVSTTLNEDPAGVSVDKGFLENNYGILIGIVIGCLLLIIILLLIRLKKSKTHSSDKTATQLTTVGITSISSMSQIDTDTNKNQKKKVEIKKENKENVNYNFIQNNIKYDKDPDDDKNDLFDNDEMYDDNELMYAPNNIIDRYTPTKSKLIDNTNSDGNINGNMNGNNIVIKGENMDDYKIDTDYELIENILKIIDNKEWEIYLYNFKQEKITQNRLKHILSQDPNSDIWKNLIPPFGTRMEFIELSKYNHGMTSNKQTPYTENAANV